MPDALRTEEAEKSVRGLVAGSRRGCYFYRVSWAKSLALAARKFVAGFIKSCFRMVAADKGKNTVNVREKEWRDGAVSGSGHSLRLK